MDEDPRRAVIVGLSPELGEIVELADSLGVEVVAEVIQKRSRPDPKTYIGTGKAEEVADVVEEVDADLVLLDAELEPVQIFHLERVTGATVFDRVRLILEIFAERANSREARLQVELARLNYEVPLVREYVDRAKRGEHPGFMAGGEYGVSNYLDLIQKRISTIEDDLDHIEDQRDLRRQSRREAGFYLVGLTGYTNAGKSSLLNALSDEAVEVEERYFSTLATTTRRLERGGRRVLLTDTVGFIRDLPPYLIDAFHSTLEEIVLSDVVVLVVDASDPLEEIRDRISTSKQILWEQEIEAQVLVALNKIDLVDEATLESKWDTLVRDKVVTWNRTVPVSAKTGEGLDDLVEAVHRLLPDDVEVRLELPLKGDSYSLISWLYDHARVHEEIEGDPVEVRAEVHPKDIHYVEEQTEELGGALEKATS